MSVLFHPPFARTEAAALVKRRMSLLCGKRIALLYGGWSAEADVSKLSAESIGESLTRLGLRWELMDATKLLESLKNPQFDIVFNVLYGELGEGGAIKSLLNECGVLSTYSDAEASSIALDKWRTKLIVASNGVKTTKSAVAWRGCEEACIAAVTSWGVWPVVCKPLTQGSSVGVSVAVGVDDLRQRLNDTVQRFRDCLVEPYLPGREYSVAVMRIAGGPARALPILEVCSASANVGVVNLDQKYGMQPLTIECPAIIPDDKAEHLASQAISAFEAVGCSPVARIDFREDERGIPQLLEVNHYPGMTKRSWLPMMASKIGLSFDHLVLEILAAALDRVDSASIRPLHLSQHGRSAADPPETVVLKGRKPPFTRATDEAVQHLSSLFDASSELFPDFLDRALNGGSAARVLEVFYESENDRIESRGALDALGCLRLGPSLLAVALTADKLRQKDLARALGIPSPRWALGNDEGRCASLQYPRVRKRRRGAMSEGVVYEDEPASAWLGGSDIIVEEYVPGRELCVGIISDLNGQLTVLPILEVIFRKNRRLNDASNKAERAEAFICPAELDEWVAAKICSMSAQLHEAIGPTPWSRTEWRLDANGEPVMIEIDPSPGFTPTSYMTEMLRAAGLDVRTTIERLSRRSGFVSLSDCRV
ncbi:hypothetical protein ACI6QG_14695 [Roseococcus sp. DSY-14]|uniref:hypothetical protein n=1 Tax=Roseococcus sp. DSY-14 TaxID=3369650 RepID=UPI00387AB63B